MTDENNCVQIQIGWEDRHNYIFATLIDQWVDEHLSECSACTYYEESGTVAERLEMGIRNEVILNGIILGTKMEKEGVEIDKQ